MEDNLQAHWGSNLRTSVCEADALPLTPQQTVNGGQKVSWIFNSNFAGLKFRASYLSHELAALLITSGPNFMSMSLSVIYLRLCLPNDQECIFRFLQCLIWWSREVPSNIVCGMKFRLQKRWGCWVRPLVILPCRSKIFISGTKTSKRDFENVLMTCSAANDHRRQQMTNTLVLKNRRLTVKDLTLWSEYQKDLWKPFWKTIWA